jgi:hypothetical protein
MQTVIRKYSGKGAAELVNLLEQHAADVKNLIGSVRGLTSYTLIRTNVGGFSVTICEDQAGIDESTQKAKDWIAKNAAHLGIAAPEMSHGKVVIQIKR